jgi:hypothetical protein
MELQEIPRQEMKAIFGEMRARMHLNIMVCQNTKFLGTSLLGGRLPPPLQLRWTFRLLYSNVLALFVMVVSVLRSSKSFKSSLQKALQ